MADKDSNTDTSNFYIVVAIDFGTSLSGFAYSYAKTTENENPDIHHYQCWNETTKKYTNIMKTATCILFDKDKNFVSFGYDAKFSFAYMTEKERYHHYFFDNFKMALDNHKGSLDALELEDIRDKGRTMLAKDVFKSSIKAIKDKVIQRLTETGIDVKIEEIRWVLTVPAIWHENSKLFMKDCAEKAGIPSYQLLIALEAEAASLYCQYLKISSSSDRTLKETAIGTKYVVVDVGGGTTDIAMHEKEEKHHLKDLHHVGGSPIGGTTVDLALLDFAEKIISDELLRRLKNEKPSDYLDLYTELEEMKKSVQPDKNIRVRIKIAYSALTKLLNRYIGLTLEQTINYTSKRNNIEAKLDDDNIILDVEKVKTILKMQINRIIVVLKKEVNTEIEQKVSHIFLVGGFAENKFLQNRVKEAFPGKKVLIPPQPGLAILKGAVLFGQNPAAIHSRKTRLTFGIEVNKSYDIAIHSPSRRVVSDWEGAVCTGCFSVIIRQNESVNRGRTIRQTFYTCKKFQESIDFKFYGATTDEPLYVDDAECTFIQHFTIEISKPSADTLVFNVEFEFDDTTIKVSMEDGSSGKLMKAKIDL